MSLMELLRRNRETAAPTLLNPKVEFNDFVDPTFLFAQIGMAYGTISAILNNELFYKAAGQHQGNHAKNACDAKRMALESSTVSSVLPNVRVQGEHVLLAIYMGSMHLSVFGLRGDATPEQKKAFEQSRGILKSILPKFNPADATGDRGINFVPDPNGKSNFPIEVLSAIKIPGVEPLDISSHSVALKGCIRFELEPARIIASESTSKIGDHTDYQLEVRVRAVVALPKKFAMWAQQADSDESYVSLATWAKFSQQHEFFKDDEATGKAPKANIQHPDTAEKIRAEFTTKYALVGNKNVDANSICVVPDGRMLWVPELPMASISKTMNSCVDAEGNIELSPLKNRGFYTDWTLGKMQITDAGAKMHLVDLAGARPPSAEALAHVQASQIPEDALAGMVSYVEEFALGNLTLDPLSKLDPKTPLTWDNLIDVPYYANEDSADRVAVDEALFALGKQFADAYYKFVQKPSTDIWRSLEIVPWLALFGPYATERKANVAKLGVQLAKNRAGVDPQATPTLHDMPGVDGVMPHQRRVIGGLSNKPKGAILGVRAGGGKSLMSISDITGLMAGGEVKRPVVIMPRNLLANFATEIVRFTKGRYRPFLISNRVWRGFQRRLGSNPIALMELLRSQPANTIFLVDYGWLTHNGATIEVDKENASSFPHAQMLLSIKPDYVCLDESHRAKKVETGRTIAAAMITGVATYRRIMSGTILHNTVADYLGQMAQIEPMALGAIGQSIKDNKNLSIDQLPELRRAVDSFARSMSVPRKEWAHLLPPIIERVHECTMTKKQQEFYQKIYARAQDQIEKDPKFQALKKADSAAAENRMMAIMKRNFVPLEQWLNAPDSEFSENQFGQVFNQLGGLSDTDLISPKVFEMDRILEEHFKGGKVDIGNGEEFIAADGNKVIVFCYNKSATEHVYRHSKFAKIGVYYQAGDDKAMEQFKKEDKVKILYASVTSVSEGHNLQCASRCIFMQSFWTPGLMEQALARVWRPDVPDKEGKIKFKRDRIYSDQVIVMPSIEAAKMARLISKQVNNLIIEEIDDNPALKQLVKENMNTFERVKPLKMTLDKIEKFQDKESLASHFRAYSLLKSWERVEFKGARDKVRAEIEKRIGKKVPDSLLAAASMTKPVHKSDANLDVPDGLQVQGFVPWTEGFTGWNNTGLHLVPIELPKEEDEEESDDSDSESESDEDSEDAVVVTKGDPVLTELGPGYVSNIRSKAQLMYVRVPGYSSEPVRLWKYAVLAAPDPETKAALALILRRAGEHGLPLLVNKGDGKLDPHKNLVPADMIDRAFTEVKSALKAGKSIDVKDPKSEVPNTKENRVTPGMVRKAVVDNAGPNKKDITDTMKGHMFVGNYEAVKGKHKKTGEPVWQVRHLVDPKDKSAVISGKGDAKAELLRRHTLDVKNGGISRAPGLPVEHPAMRGAPSKDMYPINRRLAPPPPAAPAPASKVKKPLNLNDVDSMKEERDVRTANAGLFSGVVCLITTDGGYHDPLLLKSGFDRMAKSIAIRIKNPRGLRNLWAYMQENFEIPSVNAKAMELFIEEYSTARAQIAYSKTKVLPQHNIWMKQQRTKAKSPTMIMPWPVVEKGLVYVYVNIEQLQGKALGMLKRMPVPNGCVKPVVVQPQMISMVKGAVDAKRLMMDLEKRGVDFADRDDILKQLRAIKGTPQ
jgi:hypothetical protein